MPSGPDQSLVIPAYPGVTIERHQTPWHGRFHVDVIQFRNRRFDGTDSGPRTWEVFRRGRAAAILPYDPWTDQVVLIQQFRLPALIAGVDPMMIEIPAGLCEPREPPERTARREALEETGLAIDHLVPMLDVVLTPGGSDERCAIFAGRLHAPATDPQGTAGRGGLAAEQEDIRVLVMPASAAIDAALKGRYANAVTVMALLWLAARRDTLQRTWLA